MNKKELEEKIMDWLHDFREENYEQLKNDNELMMSYLGDAENLLNDILGFIRLG